MASNDTTQAHEVPFGDNKSIYVHDVPGLDSSLYYLSEAEAAFFKAAVGIDNDKELKAHILRAQEKAYKVGFILASPTVRAHCWKFRLHRILVFMDLDSYGG